MRLWRELVYIVRRINRGRAERELDEEIQAHIEMEIEENISDGMTREQARLAALKQFGNVTLAKEDSRAMWGGRLIETFWQDLRYGVRMLAGKPFFTAVAVLALALGIGTNTAIFSAVNAVLLRPLPFADPDRVVNLFGASVEEPDTRGEFSYPDFLDYKTRSQTLEHVAAYLGSGAILSGGDEPERVTGVDVSAELFPLLGVEPLLGRVFTAEEDKIGAPALTVLSYDFWQSRFGGDPALIGQTIKLGGSRTVIGVMPPGFKFPLATENPIQYWEPLASPYVARWMDKRDGIILPLVAKLKPGVSVEQAQAELSQIAASLAAEYPATNTNRRIRVISMHDDLVRDIRPALLVLFGAVGFVLLIACANVANLLLARATARAKEMAIRSALGASRARIVRQLLVESILLASLGGAAGVLLAYWGLDLLVAMSPAGLPRVEQIGLDARVLGFTLLISVLTGILFGLTPALQASRVNLNEVMKEASRGSSAVGSRKQLRSALVVAEVALSLMLVIGAGLLVKSFARLLSTDPGYDAEGVLVMDLPISSSKYPKPEQQAAFFQQLASRVEALPGVAGAGLTTLMPLGQRDIVYSFNVEGRAPVSPGDEPAARYQIISPNYFEVMKMPLRVGRAFTEQDTAAAPQVIIINEAFARRYFPDENPLGKRLLSTEADQPPREIVAVVGDVRQLGLDQDAVEVMYVSHLQEPTTRMNLVARSASGKPADIALALRSAIREMNKDQIIWRTQTMSEMLSSSVASRRFNMVLLGAFAAMALALAAIGIFGVMSYSVTQQTHDIGIRMALGAQKSDVMRMVFGQGLRLVSVGLVLGLFGAFAVTRVLATLLYGVSTTDPAVFAGVAGLLAAVALMACYLPARRAMKINPMTALRYE
jgi:putative ABC transport system permease protein